MKIIGQMALCNFPLWKKCLISLKNKVDNLYLRFDLLNGNKDIIKDIISVSENKLKHLLISNNEWNNSTMVWREEMFRLLDIVKPDVVIMADEDEEFENTLNEEILQFFKSDKLGMMFDYYEPMPTKDNIFIVKYPIGSHMKVIKWKPNLSYIPYLSRLRIYPDQKDWWLSKTKIIHYSHYTKELRDKKILDIEKRKEDHRRYKEK